MCHSEWKADSECSESPWPWVRVAVLLVIVVTARVWFRLIFNLNYIIGIILSYTSIASIKRKYARAEELRLEFELEGPARGGHVMKVIQVWAAAASHGVTQAGSLSHGHTICQPEWDCHCESWCQSEPESRATALAQWPWLALAAWLGAACQCRQWALLVPRLGVSLLTQAY